MEKNFKLNYPEEWMRSYGQFCALAKSLDVVGDRWTLLIVRELMLRGACRYTDLREGLPGIATNLLADRLRALEAAGVVQREDAPAPIATTLFSLTARGEELRSVLDALVSWGVPYIAVDPAPGDELRSHWLAWPAAQFLRDTAPEDPPITMELRGEGEPVVVEVAAGAVRAHPGRAERPDAVFEGQPDTIFRTLAGRIDLATAQASGLRFEGDPRALQRLRRI